MIPLSLHRQLDPRIRAENVHRTETGIYDAPACARASGDSGGEPPRGGCEW